MAYRAISYRLSALRLAARRLGCGSEGVRCQGEQLSGVYERARDVRSARSALRTRDVQAAARPHSRPSKRRTFAEARESETEQKHGFTERFLKVINIKATARVGVGRLDDSVGQLSDTGTLISVSVIAS